MAAKRKTGHGGHRTGAGRKGFIKNAKVLSVKYDGDDLAELESIAEERGISVASLLRELVREYLKKRSRR